MKNNSDNKSFIILLSVIVGALITMIIGASFSAHKMISKQFETDDFFDDYE